MSVKLTTAQRDVLEIAMRASNGNPWPLIPIQRRKGGAFNRMFERMQDAGLFDSMNRITPAGRSALSQETNDE
jgi:hypothetical protein